MGQVPSIGDVVTVQPDVQKLRAGVLEMHDELEWGVTYERAAGRKGEVLGVEGGKEGTVTLAVCFAGSSERTEITVPCKCICKPDDDESGRDILKMELPVGTSVTIATSLTRMREEIERYPDDLVYDADLFRSVAGKVAVVTAVEDSFYDLELVPGEAVSADAPKTVTLPRALLAPLPKAPRRKRVAAQLCKGDSVVVTRDRAELQQGVAKYPDDLEWDDDAMVPALGAAGRVADVEGPLVSVELPSGMTVTVPSVAVRKQGNASPQSPATPREKRGVATPPPLSPVVNGNVPATDGHIYSPSCAPDDDGFDGAIRQVGDRVRVTANVQALEREVRKHPDDIEWCADTLTPAVGQTGTVVECDDGIIDVKLDGSGLVVCIPASAVSPVAAGLRSPPAALQSRTSNAPLKPGDAVVVTAARNVLRQEVLKYSDEMEWDDDIMRVALGNAGVVDSIDGDLYDVKLRGMHGVVTIPVGALSRANGDPNASAPHVPTPTTASATDAAVRVATGARVRVTADVQALEREVRKHPDDIEWCADTLTPAVGQTGTVVECDDGIIDVKLDGSGLVVCIPASAVSPVAAGLRSPPAALQARKTQPPKKAPPPTLSAPVPTPVRAVPQTKTGPPPATAQPPAQDAEPSKFAVGDEVTVTAMASVMKLHVIKARDKIEWHEERMATVLGKTGRVAACYGKCIDVAVEEAGRKEVHLLPEAVLTLVNPPPLQPHPDAKPDQDSQGCGCTIL